MHGDDKQPGGPFEGRTYLFIRDHPLDTGAEPLTSGLEFWVSPDITIIKPDGTRGTEALAGQQNQVEIYVNNSGGIDAIDAHVDVFSANPSTAFTPATALAIGSGPLTIPGYSRRALTLPWTPLATEAGHRCLLARVSLLIPPDTYINGLVFDVVGDRHISQRNLHVVSLEADDKMEFKFQIVNPGLKVARFLVAAAEVREERSFAALRGSLGCGSLRMGRSPLKDVSLQAGRKRFQAPILENMDVRTLVREDRLTPVFASRTRNKGIQVDLEPETTIDAVLSIARNPETQRGDMHAVRITQTDVDGRVVGGLTVLVQH